MLFSSQLPLPALMQWCRALRHGLDVGLSPAKVFAQQGKSGPAAARSVAKEIAVELEQGSSLGDALKPHKNRFPPLFIELVAVGEEAGRLPDIFAELEEYFETVKSARQAFVRLMTWPVLQYFLAILVITILLFVLGAIGSGMDPLGLGLTGAAGATLFFLGAMLFTGVVAGVAVFVSNNQDLRARFEAFSLMIPGLGGCFRAFALARFSLAYYMTAEAGIRADRCLKVSLRATTNKAYSREADFAAKAARKGEGVPDILGGYGPRLFPDDFMAAVQVGEDTGRLAEVMKKQADHYREESRRKLKVLAMIAGGLVYAMIGVLIIIAIFKIAMTAYIGPLNDAQRAADNPDAWLRGK